MSISFDDRPPIVRLRNYFENPYDDAIAAARTCYSMDAVEAKEVTEKQRDSIGPLTFNAGHHTVYQHATFEFTLENISRHFIWSVLHSFPYYNSDQQSQRYVRLNEIRAFLPPIEGKALDIYKQAIIQGFETYQQLSEILKEDTFKIVGLIRHLDKHPLDRLQKQVTREAEKKAIEIARYVLPIATFSSMVYTCSGLVLHRLWRLMNGGDTPYEARAVIGAMIEVVQKVDPHFFSKIGDPPLLRTDILETEFLDSAARSTDFSTWDQGLEPYHLSKLIDYTANAQGVISQSIRLALGAQVSEYTDQELTQLALDPKKNSYRVEKTNLSSHSPLMRSLSHIYYTFLKKLSHTADSQNQRHRTVMASRPLYQLVDCEKPDFFVPMLIKKNSHARETYERFMDMIWKTKNKLLEMGVPREFAIYVLPNALNIRFVESGSLLNLLHKWTLRTCLNAQEEIYTASMEEIAQVTKIHPFLSGFVGPPCVVRNGIVSPRCTEGSHFCGIPVWKTFPNIERVI